MRSWQEQDILHWLGKEAPRYTSYPSAHHFVSIAPQQYQGWLQMIGEGQSVGLYLHVPFCAEMCWFCGCNTQITHRYEPIHTYIEALILEAALVRRTLGRRVSVHSVHFGGGSPGLLEVDTFKALFGALHENFAILADAEISIELDPRRLTREKCTLYAELGFNRVSLGIQDTDPAVQAAINRIQPMDQVIEAIDALKTAGLDAIGIDLIYGLPRQTIDSLERTLRDVERMNPARVSAYSYAHVPWVKKHQRLIDAAELPGLWEKTCQFSHIAESLSQMGYCPIGIDHFARPDDGLAAAAADRTLRRNFMGYTDQPNDRLIALGASSISQLDEGIAQNINRGTSYEGLVRSGQLPTMKGWAYTEDDRARSAVIATLMCFFEVDLGQIVQSYQLPADHFDSDIIALAEFVDAGLVSIEGQKVRFHGPYKMLVRSVACVFDRYARVGAEGNRYSRVA
jgi:oxygen-independent coproporphyrinogen-3 oxidase